MTVGERVQATTAHDCTTVATTDARPNWKRLGHLWGRRRRMGPSGVASVARETENTGRAQDERLHSIRMANTVDVVRRSDDEIRIVTEAIRVRTFIMAMTYIILKIFPSNFLQRTPGGGFLDLTSSDCRIDGIRRRET